MPTTSARKGGLKKDSDTSFVKVNKDMKSHADSPFFLKKEARAKETIKKYGLPKECGE